MSPYLSRKSSKLHEFVRRHELYRGDGNDKKKSEIRKFKMADGRGIKNYFLAITQLHVVPIRWNLEWGGTTNEAESHAYEAYQMPNYENPK